MNNTTPTNCLARDCARADQCKRHLDIRAGKITEKPAEYRLCTFPFFDNFEDVKNDKR
jgi:hypothetical protein